MAKSVSHSKTHVVLGVSLLNFAVVFSAAAKPVSPVESGFIKTCKASGGAIKAEELQALLAESSLADVRVRQDFIAILRQPDNRCRKSLEAWLGDLRAHSLDGRANTGRLAAVTLGVLLNIAAAQQFIAAEAASGAGLEWLATLQQWDDKAYSALLQTWIVEGGREIRRTRGFAQLDAQLYGKTQIGDSPAAQTRQMVSPLVVDLFLKLAAQRAVSVDELGALNAIFVDLNSGARSLYLEAFGRVVRRNAVDWVSVFRRESAWTQFQLMELMGRVGGAEMVRELMWLSQNHMDTRMKIRASQALDEALNSPEKMR